MRFAAGIEYDGTQFAGWQAQASTRTVQGVVEAAVSSVANEPVVVHCAGRTDAGVHGRGQVVHFDSQAIRTPDQWQRGTNSALPADVSVRWVQAVEPSFDARRTAIWRRYRYFVQTGPSPSALAARRAWWVRDELDATSMRAAAGALIGEHDFSAFRAAGCQSHSPMRNLMAVEIGSDGEIHRFDFTANAFLYHMVRNLVGSFVEVGRGRQPPSWLAELLAKRDRTAAAPTAPPQGLTLEAVGYPAQCNILTPANGSTII